MAILIFACLSLTGFNAPGVSARQAVPSVPASMNCNSECSSWTYWNGNTYGGAVSFTLSNPGFNSSIAFYDRFIQLSSGSGFPKIIVGISKGRGGGYGSYCMGAGNNQLHFLIYAFDAFGGNIFNQCTNVPSADFNTLGSFTIVQDATCDSEGDGRTDEMRVEILSNNSFTNPCVDTETNVYSREQFREDITDTVIGHQVWGSDWVGASFVNTASQFVYQSRNVDYLTSRNPPQMYWDSNPRPGNNGGSLYSCDYDTGLTCVFGSLHTGR